MIKKHWKKLTAVAFSLGIIGVVLGWAGFAKKADLAATNANDNNSKIAKAGDDKNACIIDAPQNSIEEEQEVFFSGCGGVF